MVSPSTLGLTERSGHACRATEPIRSSFDRLRTSGCTHALDATVAAFIVALVSAVPPPVTAQQPSLNEALDRLGVYVRDYEDDLSMVVAQEDYQQWMHGQNASSNPMRYRRTLLSDFAFMRPLDNGPWVGFRDTFLVDSQPVRDRDSRLERLLAAGSRDGFEQAARIVEENARYNFGSDRVRRTINSPTLTVDFLHPRQRGRFSFRKAGEQRIDDRRVWKIDFLEHGQPPIIRTPGGPGQVTRGTVWVDPSNGAVLRTFLRVIPDAALAAQARLTVNFRREAKLDLLVPYEMRESYAVRGGDIDGVATYSNFRRFETSGRVLEK